MRKFTDKTIPPRYITPIPEGAIVSTRSVDKVAALLGRRQTFYQREISARITARWPNGDPVFTSIFVSFQRQTGKTTGVMDVAAWRAMTKRDQRIWLTAQTGLAARERFLNELGNPIGQRLEHVGGLADLKLSAGSTRVAIPITGSEVRPMPPTSEYLHGGQGDLIIIDECWAFDEEKAQALTQAIAPTMLTRLQAQTIKMSAAGGLKSTWWHRQLEAAIAEPKPRVAVIDYGVGTTHDPATETSFTIDDVVAAHPGVVCGLTTREKLLEPLDNGEMTFPEWLRAYGNIRSHLVTERVIDLALVEKITTTTALDPGPVAIGVAATYAGDTTAVAAAGTIGGIPAIEIIEARPGRQWAIELIDGIISRGDAYCITGDAVGPAKRLCDQLQERYPEKFLAVTTDDLIAETEDFLSACTTSHATPPVLIRKHAALTHELDTAELRAVGEKGRLFSRRHSANGTARIESALVALAATRHPPTPKPQPLIWSK